MAYATIDEYVLWSGGTAPSAGSPDEDLLQACLDAASEAIDEHCLRTFTAASSATSGAREYTVLGDGCKLFVDDFIGDATIDGEVQTVRAPQDPHRPNTTLIGSWTPGDTVTVVAEWGWAETPARVKLACLMLTAKLDQRRQSPNGIEQGSGEIGFIRILGVDKDVEELLRTLRRLARTFA